MTRKIDKNFLTQKQITKMKSIKQQVEVSFNAVEIGDVVKLLPIMDAISSALDKQEALQLQVGNNPYVEFSAESLVSVYNTLKKLGFCNSLDKDPEIISRLGENKQTSGLVRWVGINPTQVVLTQNLMVYRITVDKDDKRRIFQSG